MSSFWVIQISAEPVNEDNRLGYSLLWEDPIYNEKSDYDNDPVPFREAVESIRNELKSFATVNAKKRTITLLDKETVKAEYLKRIEKAMDRFREDFAKGQFTMAEFHLRNGVREVGIEDLFHDRYCKTFSAVITEYLAGYLPQTVYIGSILSAHC